MKRKKPLPPVIHLITVHFGSVPDPRIDRTKHHPLLNILVMALCGAICGADGWEGLEDFAESRVEWFETLLDMPHGTPSADTFRRVFCALDPRRFEEAFRRWVTSLATELAGQVVAIDGKSLRGAIDQAGSTTPMHLLHVFAAEQQLLLAQRAVEGAPGETGSIPELLQLVDVRGATVTADANACTAAVTDAARKAGADYLITLKGNRGPLHAFVAALFEEAEAHGFGGMPTHRSTDEAHGRQETRTVRAMPLLAWPSSDQRWTDVETAVMIDRTRCIDGKETAARHFYITSLPPDPERIAQAARAHWSIENQLHWALDVGFGEDHWRIRDNNGAHNFALVARVALTMLKRETSAPGGILRRRRRAGWSNDYLLRVLSCGITAV